MRETLRRNNNGYRPLVAALAALGILFLASGALVETARQVLFALGGTGLFLAALTYYLFPDRRVSVSVCERSYDAFARLGDELVRERDLLEAYVYVPTEGAAPGSPGVELFIPKSTPYALPDSKTLASEFAIDAGRRRAGLSITPIGSALYADVARMNVDAASAPPDEVPVQLAEALVHGLELADYAAPVSGEDDKIAIGIRGQRFGPPDRFDHPVTSFLASGLAIGLGRPVAVVEVDSNSSRYDYVVTFADASEILRER